MQSDQSSGSAPATSRRRFLARTAAGGAIAAVGASALPVGPLLGIAGAQEDPTVDEVEIDLSTDEGFAAFVAPLEWVGVQAYQAAIDGGLLDTEWTDRARLFQAHHQDVVTAVSGLLGDGATEPTPDAELLSSTTAAVEAAGNQDAVLEALAELETTLAATHLNAVDVLGDGVTAKLVTQVLAVENQQAVLLELGSGSAVDDVTPPEVTTEGALTPGEGASSEATTTTTAGN